jgi:hypothetical protein
MSQIGFNQDTTEELLARFTALAVRQSEAQMDGDIAGYNRLFRQMTPVVDELKARPGDQRIALRSLYQHPNAQVRLMAAKYTLAVLPEPARQLLQTIADSGEMHQAGDAGMCLWNLDQGIFKPI